MLLKNVENYLQARLYSRTLCLGHFFSQARCIECRTCSISSRPIPLLGYSALSPINHRLITLSFAISSFPDPILHRRRIDQSFGIRIFATGPIIALLFRGRKWIGRPRPLHSLLIRSTRHSRLSETQINMCRAPIKVLVFFSFYALQSSVLAGPKIRSGGRPPTAKCTLELVLNCLFLETLGASHAASLAPGVHVRKRNFTKASAGEMCTIQVQEN